MITTLAHHKRTIAEQIHSVFQASYKLEAKLIQAQNFPPLKRTVEQIAQSNNVFIAMHEGRQLSAVIEMELASDVLEIHSLVVAPEFFRKGIAGQLLQHVFSLGDFEKTLVETASKNKPAILLYEKHGFKEIKRWTPEHRIEKVAMLRA